MRLDRPNGASPRMLQGLKRHLLGGVLAQSVLYESK